MPVSDGDYRKRLADRRLLLSRGKQKTGREKAFSSPAPKKPMINANLRGANFMQEGGAGKAVEAYLDWENLKSAAEQPMSTAKGFGKLGLLSMGPGTAAAILGPKEALAAMLMQDSDVNKASAVTGILPMGSIQRTGVRGASKAMHAFEPNIMAAEDIVPESILKNLLRRTSAPETQASREALARETSEIVIPRFEQARFTGREWQDIATGGPTGIIDAGVAKLFGRKHRVANIPSGTPSEQRAAVENTIARSIEATNVGTISGRQAQDLKGLNDELTENGFEPLPGINELRNKSHRDTMANPGSASTYDPATISRNTDVAMSTHGIGAGFEDAALLQGNSKAQHIMENDHLIGTGFATWYLNKTKPKKITQDWRDEAAGFIDWINSGDNMQRVGRMWNQVKNGQNFDIAMRQFQNEYKDAASGQFTDPYLDYVSGAFNSFKQHMGTKKGKEIMDEWGSSNYATYNAEIQKERAAYIKAAKGMKNKQEAVAALISKGFTEEEAYGYIY